MVEICVNANNHKLATKLIERISNNEERAELYLSMGHVEEAFLLCKDNTRMLILIRQHPNTKQILRNAINKILEKK